jgi:hypothetical protein
VLADLDAVFDATGDVVIALTAGNATGFSATADHAATAIQCRVAVGTALPAGDNEGEVTCA